MISGEGTSNTEPTTAPPMEGSIVSGKGSSPTTSESTATTSQENYHKLTRAERVRQLIAVMDEDVSCGPVVGQEKPNSPPEASPSSAKNDTLRVASAHKHSRAERVRQFIAEMDEEAATRVDTLKSNSPNKHGGSYTPPLRRQRQVEAKLFSFRGNTLVKSIGWAASASTIVVGFGMLVSSVIPSSGEGAKLQNETTTVSAAMTTQTEPPASSTTVPSSSTEAQPITFEAQPGEWIGVLTIPALCESIQIFEYSEQDKIEDLIGTGQALIDRKTPNPLPTNESCARIDQHEQQVEQTGRDYLSRSERVRPSAVSTENPSGKVDFWQPLAGHEQRTDGMPTSVYPGQPGNSVFLGHGSTYSAPFADQPALLPGDVATFTRSDGREYTYSMIGYEVVDDSDWQKVANYTLPGVTSTLSTVMCSSAEGETGSGTSRYVVRWGQTSAK